MKIFQLVRVLVNKQAVINSDRQFTALRHRGPVDNPLDLAAVLRLGPEGVRIAAADQFDHRAVLVPDNLVTADDAGVAQPDFTTRAEAEELFRRVFHEIASLDIDLPGQQQLPFAQLRFLRMIRRRADNFIFRQVGNHHLERIKHRLPPRRRLVELLADTLLEHRQVDARIGLADTDPFTEGPDGGGRVAAPAHTDQGRHTGVIPAGDPFFGDQLQQLALAHDRVTEAEPGKFDLLRREDFQLPQQPVVQRPVVGKFERAD